MGGKLFYFPGAIQIITLLKQSPTENALSAEKKELTKEPEYINILNCQRPDSSLAWGSNRPVVSAGAGGCKSTTLAAGLPGLHQMTRPMDRIYLSMVFFIEGVMKFYA
jgi:hypothetical protein